MTSEMDSQTQWAVEQIQRYLREGNAAAVIEIGTRLLPFLREDDEAFLRAAQCLALAHEQRGEWEPALHWFDECRARNAGASANEAARGRVLLKMGRHREARDVFLELTRRHPQRAEYHAAAGTALLHLRKPEEALDHLRRARQLNPADPYILNDIAGTHFLLGDLEAALSAYKQAIEQVSNGDRSLLRDIRESVEEVRAAQALRRHAAGEKGEAQIAEVAKGEERKTKDEETCSRRRRDADRPHSEDVPPEGEVGLLTSAATAAASGENRVRMILPERMGALGLRPRQILAALHLWSDFFDSLSEKKRRQTERHAESWVAAAAYAIGRIERAPWGDQKTISKAYGISVSAISRRFTALRRALSLEKHDPRYSTRSLPKSPTPIS